MHQEKQRPLTKKQLEVLNFINNFILKAGYPPTIREICSEFGFNSPNAAKGHLDKLKTKGFLTNRNHKSRGWHPAKRPIDKRIAKALALLEAEAECLDADRSRALKKDALGYLREYCEIDTGKTAE